MSNVRNAFYIVLLIVGVGLVFQLVSPYISGKAVASNPVISYAFDDGTIAGKIGNAKSFNGASDYVPLTISSLKLSQLSVETWFKTSSASYMMLYRARAYGTFLTMSGGVLSFNYFDSSAGYHSVASTIAYNDNQWHHAVGTYDGNNLKLYVDGILISTTPSINPIYYASYGGAAIGRDGDYSGSYFNGALDEFRIYNRALTAQEVLGNYQTVTIPIVSYSFDDGTVTGKVGNAKSFNGASDYVTLTPTSLKLPQLSVETWFKTTYSGDMMLYRWRSYGTFLRMSNGILSINYFDQNAGYHSVASTIAYNDNQWHHAVGTYDGSNIKLYIDGQLVSTTPSTAAIYYPASGGASIGRDGDYSGSYFNGVLDEFRIYNRALTSDEVSQACNCPVQAPTLPTPVVSYPFDDGTVTGKIGNAKSFNGVSDYVMVDSTPLRTAQLSVETWFKTTSNSSMDLYNYYMSSYLSMISGKLNFVYGTQQYMWIPVSVVSIATYNDGNWHHAVGTYDGSNLKLYVDGALIATTPSTAAINYLGTGGLAIGRNGQYSGSYFNGILDEFKFYDRALTVQEVLGAYQVTAPTQTSSIPNGLLSSWTFDDTTNLGKDSVDSDDGTVYGATSVTGRAGNALQFNGTGDRVIASTINNPTAITVSAWVNIIDTNNYQWIVSKWVSTGSSGNSYLLLLNAVGPNFLNFAVQTSSDTPVVSSNVDIRGTGWRYITGTYDGATLKIYIDGVLKNSNILSATSGPIQSSTTQLSIGARHDSLGPVKGIIDEVKMYNRALSSSEILTNYCSVSWGGSWPTKPAICP